MGAGDRSGAEKSAVYLYWPSGYIEGYPCAAESVERNSRRKTSDLRQRY